MQRKEQEGMTTETDTMKVTHYAKEIELRIDGVMSTRIGAFTMCDQFIEDDESVIDGLLCLWYEEEGKYDPSGYSAYCHLRGVRRVRRSGGVGKHSRSEIKLENP